MIISWHIACIASAGFPEEARCFAPLFPKNRLFCYEENQISVMKRGNRDLKISEVENIASCLGVSITDLFTWPERYVLEQSAGAKGLTTPKVILQLELEDSDVKADVIKLAFGDRVLEIKNK